MCRSKASGGRRCPSHNDPAKRDAFNARRRERYAAKKQEALASVSSAHVVDVSDPVEPDVRIPEWVDSVSFSKSEDGLETHSDLGITSQRFAGELADINFFAATQVAGNINDAALDADSYKAFGFDDPHEYKSSQLRGDVYESLDKASRKEQAQAALANTESNAAKEYTSLLYKTVNAVLRKQQNVQDFPTYEPFGSDTENLVDGSYSPSLPWIQEYTTYMDNALSKGSGVQRKLYRGLDLVSAESYDEMKEKFGLGKELVFDDYQSTTLTKHIAMDFALYQGGSHGAVFEIVSPQGLHLGELSYEAGENEVVLPRQARYMVVGSHQTVVEDADNESKPILVVQMVAVDENKNILTSEQGHDKPEPLTKENIAMF